jgi:hypothetical protein
MKSQREGERNKPHFLVFSKHIMKPYGIVKHIILFEYQ